METYPLYFIRLTVAGSYTDSIDSSYLTIAQYCQIEPSVNIDYINVEQHNMVNSQTQCAVYENDPQNVNDPTQSVIYQNDQQRSQ